MNNTANKIKVGVFFGGTSREREIAFAGGRTVYDNLDKNLFEPVPLFIDSLGHFILLDWQYIYKGTTRDFYPPIDFYPPGSKQQMYIENLGDISAGSEVDAMIDQVGKEVQPAQFKDLIDVAFLALHGPDGEDGALQGLLQFYGIPYSGSGMYGTSVGIDKILQKHLMQAQGFNVPDFQVISRAEWLSYSDEQKQRCFQKLQKKLGKRLVVKSPRQGSSIGVSILSDSSNVQDFESAVDQALFCKHMDIKAFQQLAELEKDQQIALLADPINGLGLPAQGNAQNFFDASELREYLEYTEDEQVLLESWDGESQVLIESFIQGKEFSTIVIRDERGKITALPPTEIRKRNEVFDYRSKYLPGMSRKITPIDLPADAIDKIRSRSEALFEALGFNVYARIDGFITEADQRIYLNDPNTTSGMLPSSFFFHQAAEVGLNPSQFITYIIHQSLVERSLEGGRLLKVQHLFQGLDAAIQAKKSESKQKTRIAVIMGGYSTERHISVESGRNVFEKLASSEHYQPIPFFLTGNDASFQLYTLPLHMMLKDNADDIRDSIERVQKGSYQLHPVIEQVREATKALRSKFSENPSFVPEAISIPELAKTVDEVFIALHGRPGEDGNLQVQLEKVGLPYNGSGPSSSRLTINKFETNEKLKEAGLSVAKHRMVNKIEWQGNPEKMVAELEEQFGFPLVAKPADDGCSSAVKMIQNPDELLAFGRLIFREQEALIEKDADTLHLKYNEEFPIKEQFLVESLIDSAGAKHFLEVTGGLLTHYDEAGNVQYEVFEPSEAVATSGILSLEEKFLAGQGQNITPARFSEDLEEQKRISQKVREDLRKTAEIMGVEGYARIDAFVKIMADGEVETIIIEINSLPGMTPATCIFHQAAINEYKPLDFISKIMDFGEQRRKKQSVVSD